jgi:hypothetical protein
MIIHRKMIYVDFHPLSRVHSGHLWRQRKQAIKHFIFEMINEIETVHKGKPLRAKIR